MKHTIKLALAFVLIAVLFVWTFPMKSWACHIDVDGWMTDTEGRPIPNNTFNLVVKKNGIIVSTNPGGFFYHIQVSTVGWALNWLDICAVIPPEFNLHGGKPVKVFLDGSPVSTDGDVCPPRVYDIPAHSVVTVQIHLKFAKQQWSPPYPKDYDFTAIFNFDEPYGVSGSAQATLTAELP